MCTAELASKVREIKQLKAMADEIKNLSPAASIPFSGFILYKKQIPDPYSIASQKPGTKLSKIILQLF